MRAASIVCVLMFCIQLWAFIACPQPYGIFGLVLWPFCAWMAWSMRKRP